MAVAGTDVEVTARVGPSYPVGSTFRSKPKASAELDVADGTTCLLLGQSEISVVPAPDNLADRIVIMSRGTIQVTSTGEGPEVGVRTPGGLCSAGKGSFACAVGPAKQAARTDIVVIDGSATIIHDSFRIPRMETGSEVSITSSETDLVLLVTGGSLEVTVPGPYGTEVTRELPEGAMMVIGWAKKDDEQYTTFVAFARPDGVEESWEVVTMGEGPEEPASGDGPTVDLNLSDFQDIITEYVTPEGLKKLLTDIGITLPYAAQ